MVTRKETTIRGKRKVLAITGGRADFGLMEPVYKAIERDADLELRLVVTGMHLLPEFTGGLDEVRRKIGNYEVTEEVEAEGKSMSEMLGGIALAIGERVRRLKPEVLLLQGDRPEMLAAAAVGVLENVVVVHMSGGDYSGTVDDSLRNGITKLAHVHLTTCKQSSRRLVEMGEEERRVFEVGEPGLDAIRVTKRVSKEKLAKELGLDFGQPVILGGLHPVVTEADEAGWQMGQLMEALEEVGYQTVLTYPNSDLGREKMVKVLKSYEGRKWLRVRSHVDHDEYLGLMEWATVMVGNSSSGIIEAPSFKLPVVNVGTRQYGRVRAGNVIDVGNSKEEILGGLKRVTGDEKFREQVKKVVNPYGDGHTAEKVAEILKRVRCNRGVREKWRKSDELILKGTEEE